MISNLQSTCSDAYLDKLRVVEALLARDYAVHQMENTFSSLQTKEAAIMQLLTEKAHLESQLETLSLEEENKTGAREGGQDNPSLGLEMLAKENAELKAAFGTSRASSSPANSSPPKLPIPASPKTPSVAGPDHLHKESESPESIIKARYAILAGLPVPSDMPTDILVPIVIPPPFTLQDFIGTISGPLRLQLASYRVFQETTTCWCPDREEHGYYITPVYRCNTNPRVSTAHRWITVDLDAELNKPTECFFKKEGKWYYAGIYKTFRLRDIAPQEWTRLAPETTQALIKDTITHRKNTSPQNIYETGQLYAVGALKAACIGLQCIGFNEALYKGLLTQAAACAKTGRWRGAVVGLGTGATWNSNANAGAENVKAREEVNNTEVGAAPEKT